MIWVVADILLEVEAIIRHWPIVGTVLDTLLGPHEDFQYVSKTTPVEPLAYA